MKPDANRPYPLARRELPDEAKTWLRENPEADAEGMEEIWKLTENALPFGATYYPGTERVANMRRTILERIERDVAGSDRPKVRILRLGRTWAVAASVLFAALIGTILVVQPVTISAPVGELVQVDLPDGSQVLLNSGSSLERGRLFGWWHRSVELEGEAYFDIAAASDPFEVHTFNGVVTVFGTHFNVRAWSQVDNPETQVILTEGSVSLAPKSDLGSDVTLEAGQMSRISGPDSAPTIPVAVNTEALLIWRSGGLAYFDATIAAVLDDIKRRFGIDVSASQEIRERSVSISLSEVQNVAAVLDVLAGAHGLAWSLDGARYRLSEMNEE